MSHPPIVADTDTPDSRVEPARSVVLRVEHARLGYPVDGHMHVAVEDVGFDISQGETVMLLGPSGCGKSTLLKAVAGFIETIAGSVTVTGRSSLRPGPDRAVVFQEFDQLFPWRTVLGNVAYPLRRNGRTKSDAYDRARKALETVGLASSVDRFPHQLSGGMKQRAAIARALALEPLILLMDEPFGALDALTRTRLQGELNAIADDTDVTILFVTHSIDEAIALGDRVIVLSEPPSTVRSIVTINAEAKTQGSPEHGATHDHLHDLLTPTEAANETPDE